MLYMQSITPTEENVKRALQNCEKIIWRGEKPRAGRTGPQGRWLFPKRLYENEYDAACRDRHEQIADEGGQRREIDGADRGDAEKASDAKSIVHRPVRVERITRGSL